MNTQIYLYVYKIKMTQKHIKIFINEIYSKGPKRNYATNKTDVYYIDDI